MVAAAAAAAALARSLRGRASWCSVVIGSRLSALPLPRGPRLEFRCLFEVVDTVQASGIFFRCLTCWPLQPHDLKRRR